MPDSLAADELVALIKRVFEPSSGDKKLALLVDLPDGLVPDNEDWRRRRQMVGLWFQHLTTRKSDLGLEEIHLVLYPNAHANNADLPEFATYYRDPVLPTTAEAVDAFETSFEEILAEHQILIAPTHFSATAPLKNATKKFGCRAATMPGFTEAMIPALRIDYGVVSSRVNTLKQLLDNAVQCDLEFSASGEDFQFVIDLRYRKAHASSGAFPVAGEAGNLPSGEAYIVPYEGERSDDPSQTEGLLPVQIGDDIVVYRVMSNKAVAVLSDNETSQRESELLKQEPAYGNIAELGLGVLGDFGLEPTGEILLDEKLGLHIAFGRSEHFGGTVGPDSFRSRDRVVHIDRVYIPKLQPKIQVRAATFKMADGSSVPLMERGGYVISFES